MVRDFTTVNIVVETVRFKGNGTIFTGQIIDNDGVQTGEEMVVRCPGNILLPRDEVFKGEVWTIGGHKETYKGQLQLGATRALLNRPCGENIIAAIAFNPKFESIGLKKARDLWTVFGEGLYDLLDSDEPDLVALHQVLTPEVAERLLRIWRAEFSGDIYRWMDEHQIPKALVRRLQEHYGKEARAKLEEDPYRVLAFGQTWRKVDDLARRIGITEDDPRRLHAAVAEVLYQHFGKGHTAMSTAALTGQVARLLGHRDIIKGQKLARVALKNTYADGAFIHNGDLWQATGVFLMEAFVADRLRKMIINSNSQQFCFSDLIVQQAINRFEKTYHQLGDEQKASVHLALESQFCIITGSAGVGKTSTLRCLYNSIEASNGSILQMALSGRAARRMEETSGRPARTIAGFQNSIKQEDLANVTHVVIDEASMLDLVTAFQILRKLPKRIKLILVGDPYQLPPIGAGLTFHVLADNARVPIARLTKVYRQSGASGIPAISNSVRKGEWPHIPEYRGRETGIFKLQIGPEDIGNRIIEIYEEIGGVDEPEEVQILSTIKADNPFGVAGINKSFHARYTEGENLVLVPSPDGELKDSGFRQGDRIMVTRNQWDRMLFNGSLGYISEAFEKPVLVDDDHYVVARAIIDGREILLSQEDLDWIVHSYSISVHKSQGSQFTRIIVPICKSRLLDRTLLYTAITRGIDQVVVLGDMNAAKSAVEAPPHAWLRQIGFDTLLHAGLE